MFNTRSEGVPEIHKYITNVSGWKWQFATYQNFVISAIQMLLLLYSANHNLSFVENFGIPHILNFRDTRPTLVNMLIT